MKSSLKNWYTGLGIRRLIKDGREGLTVKYTIIEEYSALKAGCSYFMRSEGSDQINITHVRSLEITYLNHCTNLSIQL